MANMVYLDGLDRLPTTAEVKAIPAPTPQQGV